MGLEILILQVKQTRMIWIRGADPKENNSQSGADPCGKKVRIRLRDKTVQIRPNETDPWHVHTACLEISTFYNMSQGCNQIPVISEFAFWQRRKPVSCVPPPPPPGFARKTQRNCRPPHMIIIMGKICMQRALRRGGGMHEYALC